MEVKRKGQINIGLLIIIGLVLLVLFSLGGFGGVSKTVNEQNEEEMTQTDFSKLNEGETYQATLTIDDKTGDVKVDVEKTQVVNYTDNLITNNTLSVGIVEDGQYKTLNWDLNNNVLKVNTETGEEIYNLNSIVERDNLKIITDGTTCKYILVYPIYNKNNWLILTNNEGVCSIGGGTSRIDLNYYSKNNKGIMVMTASRYSWGGRVCNPSFDLKNMKIKGANREWNGWDSFVCKYTNFRVFKGDGYNLEIDLTKEPSGCSGCNAGVLANIIEGATKMESFTITRTDTGYLEVDNVSLNLNVGDDIYIKGDLKGIADLGADVEYTDAYGDLQFKNDTAITNFLNELTCDKIYFRDDQPTKYELECYVNNDITFDEGSIYLKVITYEDHSQNLLGKLTELIADLTGIDYDVWEQAVIYGNQKGFRILIDKDKVNFDLKDGAFKGKISFNGDNYRGLKIDSGKVEDKNILIKEIPELDTYYLSVSDNE
jgi:hypothetical protein